MVLGPIADQVAGEIRSALRGGTTTAQGGAEWIAALGGAANIEDLQHRSTRLVVRLADAAKLDEPALKRLGARAVVRSEGGRVHVLLDETTGDQVAAAVQPA